MEKSILDKLQTSNFRFRVYNHTSELKRNIHRNSYLQNVYNKYGIDNFAFIAIEECDESIMDDREVYWMNFYDSCNRDNGYNLILGGSVNRHHSEETKIKISKSLTGKKRGAMPEEIKNKIRIANTGHIVSDETKRKMSLIIGGRTLTEEQ